MCPSGLPPPPIPAPIFLGFFLFIHVCPSTQFTQSPSCVPGHTQPVPERSQTESGGPSESGGQSGAEGGRSRGAAEALAGNGDGNCWVLLFSTHAPGLEGAGRLTEMVAETFLF